MHYPETSEAASKFALSAIKRLKEQGIAANPINFSIWYEYFAGKNDDLKKTVDSMITADTTPNEDAYADLYNRFIVAGANTARDKDWSERIEAVTDRIVDALTTTGSEMEEYGQALNQRVNESADEINALRKALDDSRRDALTDSLTGVANRKCFDQEIFAAAQETLETGQPLSLILADLDHFKTFNDTYDHQLGDQVLRLVGKALYDSVKGKDTAARYGGEEFAIILPDTTSGGATTVAENIRKTVASKRLQKKGPTMLSAL